VMKIQKISVLIEILYFLNIALYLFDSIYHIINIDEYLSLLRIPFLLALYLLNSKKKNIIYMLSLLMYEFSAILFTQNYTQSFQYATIFSLIFKISLTYILIDLLNKSYRKAVGFTLIPIFVLYLYVISFILNDLSQYYFVYWIVNFLITALIGSIGVINFVNESTKNNVWLLFGTMLFVIQIVLFSLNKYYFKNDYVYEYNVLFYAFAHYAIYRFIILQEKSEAK